MKSDSDKSYQFVVLYGANLAQEKQKKDLKELVEFVESKGSKLSFVDWGEKTLAYEIEDNTSANFWLGEIKTSEKKPMNWNELATFLNRNKLIIRHLILKN